MTALISSLFPRIKAVRGQCLEVAQVLEDFLAENPDVDPREARAIAMMAGRAPFPSISGNPPVYRDRPYYDARFFEKP